MNLLVTKHRSIFIKTSSCSFKLPIKLNCRQNLQIRYYARQSNRRRTSVEEPTKVDEETGLWKAEQAEQADQEPPEPTTDNSLTPDVRRHLSKVYGTMTAGIGLGAVGVIASYLLPVLSLPCLIGGMITSFAIAFGAFRSNMTQRQNLFLGTGFLFGAGIAPLVLTSAPGTVFAALLGTSALFGGFSLAALNAKNQSFLMLGGPLLGGLLFLLVSQLAAIFLPLLGVTNPVFLGALYNISIYGGLALFSLFIAYDTQKMIQDYKMGNDDHVQPAMNMFLNLLQIFIRLLEIFRRS